METNTYHHHLNNLNGIKKSCEKLISETQCDIEIFKNEQQHLHKQIQEIQVENDLINSKLEELRNTTTHILPTTLRTGGESRDDATREKFANEAFVNAKNVIEYLKTENNDLRILNSTFEKTIEDLRNEIQNYRDQLFKPTSICEMKQKYVTAIQLLESTIKRKNSELAEQSRAKEILIVQKKQLSERIEKTDKLLEEQSEELQKFVGTKDKIIQLEGHLYEIETHNKELQKSLKMSKQLIDKRYMKEQTALQKVQEALSIAEAAEADKQEALKRERIMKEELDNIASTIGHVMDEAALKVENDVEAIKNKYTEKEKILNEQKDKLDEEIKNQKKFNQILNTRCQRFQHKYLEVEKHNDNLSNQLEQASKALWNLKEEVKKIEHQNNEICRQKNSMDQDCKIQQFLKNNRHLRERSNTTINDLTHEFENNILKLQDEISRLKAENEAVKLQKNK